MVVVGIDLGASDCVISFVRRGMVDIALNETSQRQTPNMVGFTDDCRVIGAPAEQNFSFNSANTVCSVTRYLGLKYSQIPESDLKGLTCKYSRSEDDELLFHVRYLGEDRTFNSIEITAMLLGKLKETVETYTGLTGVDAVLSAPVYYIDSQYRALAAAAKIAGINVMKILASPTAAAIEFGLYKEHLPKKDEKPIIVVFADVGHADTSISVVSITETKVKVIASSFDRNLGGRDFEEVLFNYFADKILEKYKLDIRSNVKASKRLMDASAKIKKTLSANPVAKTQVECIMNDVDVSLEIDRDTFESLSADILRRFEIPAKRAMEESKVNSADIDHVELIGGLAFVPTIRQILTNIFDRPVMSTTNVVECFARGCSIQGAMLSPSIRLAKDFQVEDVVVHPIDIGYESSTSMSDVGEVEKKTAVFKRGEDLNQVFKMTFKKNSDFELLGLYSDASLLPPNTSQCFGKFIIKDVPTTEGKTAVKTRIKNDVCGRFQVEEAWWEKKVEYEVEKKVEITEDEMKDEAAAPASQEGEKSEEASENKIPETKEKKYKTVMETKTRIEKYKLRIEEIVLQPTPEEIKKYSAAQAAMARSDYVYASTNEAKNNLESYSYEVMDKVYEGGEYYKFIDPNVRDTFANELQEAVDWIYGDGENETKEAYDKRLNALKAVGVPAARRADEFSSRPRAIENLRSAILNSRQFAQTTEENFSHIGEEDRLKVFGKSEEVEQWLAAEIAEQDKLQSFQDPVLTTDLLREKEKSLTSFTNQIMNKPKPKPAPESKPEEKKDETVPTEEKMDTKESV